MNRRNAVVALAVAGVLMAGAVAWISWREAEPVAPPPARRAESKSARPSRPAEDRIPFSPSRIAASPADSGSHVAHKTPAAPPLPKAPMRSILPGLLEKAYGKPPSAEAAMSAYEILLMCKRMAANPPAQPNPEAPDCAGLTENDWKDAARLLKLAAELGNERAQLTYAQRLIGLGRDPRELAGTPEELAEVHQKAREYLNSLSDRGNVDAMWFLGESLRIGDTSERDLLMAYAYKYAVARAGGYPYTIDSELSAIESQLSPQDQARARAIGDQLIARCCSGR